MTTRKTSVSFRLSNQALEHLDTITRATGATKTATVETALALMANQFKGDIEMKTLEELLTIDLQDTKLHYVGSVFGDPGDEPWEDTGKSIWLDLLQMFDEDELNETPVYDHHPMISYFSNGWYFQTGNLWNKSALGEECVFEIIN